MPPPSERELRVLQGLDIASRARGAERGDWLRSIRENAGKPPWEGLVSGGPDPNDPRYAVEALRGNVEARMGRQAREATLPYVRQGGIPPTGAFQEGGTVPPPPDIGLGAPTPPGELPGAPGPGPRRPEPRFSINPGRGGGNPFLAQMQQNVAAPLHRVEGFQYGGLVPETGNYKMHGGETVVPVTHTTTTDLFAGPEAPKRPPPEPAGQTPGYHQPKSTAHRGGLLERPPGFARGGSSRDTGIYQLHAGEDVVPASHDLVPQEPPPPPRKRLR
jgi:hypothetical protein